MITNTNISNGSYSANSIYETSFINITNNTLNYDNIKKIYGINSLLSKTIFSNIKI